MSFEPQKFFIGLIDFFSILLPGALLTYVLKDDVGSVILGKEAYRALAGTELWMAFLFSSYLLGHFIFLLGSWLDEVYEFARKRTLNRRIWRLAWKGSLPPKWQRCLLWMVFKREQDLAVNRVNKIKAVYLEPLQAAGAVNAFQWAKARLTAERPEALAVVQRFEADSKFFRSLVVLLALLPFLGGSARLWTFACVSLVFLPMALWRYMEQRYKSTNQAYWSVLTLEGQSGKVTLPKSDAAPDVVTHAGGVVFRSSSHAGVEYLLVRSSKNPLEWVLPKGHVELGEHPRETAVREVREEAGVWARIRSELARVSFSNDGKPVNVQFYLMEKLEQATPSDYGREHAWLPLNGAIDKARHDQSKALLMAAEKKRSAADPVQP